MFYNIQNIFLSIIIYMVKSQFIIHRHVFVANTMIVCAKSLQSWGHLCHHCKLFLQGVLFLLALAVLELAIQTRGAFNSTQSHLPLSLECLSLCYHTQLQAPVQVFLYSVHFECGQQATKLKTIIFVRMWMVVSDWRSQRNRASKTHTGQVRTFSGWHQWKFFKVRQNRNQRRMKQQIPRVSVDSRKAAVLQSKPCSKM